MESCHSPRFQIGPEDARMLVILSHYLLSKPRGLLGWRSDSGATCRTASPPLWRRLYASWAADTCPSRAETGEAGISRGARHSAVRTLLDVIGCGCRIASEGARDEKLSILNRVFGSGADTLFLARVSLGLAGTPIHRQSRLPASQPQCPLSRTAIAWA